MLERVLHRAREHPGLLVGIDSMRRAFKGEDIASDVADTFFREVLLPLRRAGCTVAMLAHPPKTSASQKTIADENMVRGSGDFVNQLDGYVVFRPISRRRIDDRTEDIQSRLTHAKARNGRLADPLVVTMHVTGDETDLVAFRFSGAAASTADEVAGATRAVALLAEELKRFSRTSMVKALAPKDIGRKAVDAALKLLVGKGVIRGPLKKKTEKSTGERGHWYVFVRPFVVDAEADPDDEEDPT